jgi:nucleoside-diphosphate-sugar epimerase
VRVVVTGAAGAIGRRVVSRLVQVDDVEILAVDKKDQRAIAPGADAKRVDLAAADLVAVFSCADVVVHLATVTKPGMSEPAAEQLELAIVRRVLDAAADAGVGQVVLVSSAMVYGAWEGNPVPLTEDAPVRPNPDFSWAAVRAAVEQLALEWGTGRPGVAVAVLRPAAVVADDDLGQLARVLHAARVGVAAVGDPPVQYVHVDDLAAAVATVVAERFDGVANVAPDGWIPPDALRDLEGPTPRLRVPSWAARGLAAIRWRAGLAPTPPGVVPYTAHGWVVSNDRLRSLGWRAEHTNEEAWVVSHEPGPLDRIPARRRQELALVGAVVAVVGVVVAVGYLIWRLRRK